MFTLVGAAQAQLAETLEAAAREYITKSTYKSLVQNALASEILQNKVNAGLVMQRLFLEPPVSLTVGFRIGAEYGEIVSARIIKSSGSKEFDRLLVGTLRKIRFPPPPSRAKSVFTIPIKFNDLEECNCSTVYDKDADDLALAAKPLIHAQHYESIALSVIEATFQRNAPYAAVMISELFNNPPKPVTIGVQYSIGEKGDILSLSVEESSGNKRFDSLVVGTFREIKLAPPPARLRGKKLIYNVSFELSD